MIHAYHPDWIWSLFSTTTTIDVRQGFWKSFSSPAKFVILFQTLIITFLSVWMYEEYLNNRYLQAYVNDQVATAGWMFGLAAVVLILGSLTFVISHRNKGVQLDVTGIEPLPAKPQAKREAPPAPRLVAPPKPATSFHPVVAALKAEMQGTPVPLGAPIPMTTPGATTLQAPAPRFEDKTEHLQHQTPFLRIPDPRGPDVSQTVATGTAPVPGTPSTVVTSAFSKKQEKEGSAEQKSSN
jgi:hypothetical protein